MCTQQIHIEFVYLVIKLSLDRVLKRKTTKQDTVIITQIDLTLTSYNAELCLQIEEHYVTYVIKRKLTTTTDFRMRIVSVVNFLLVLKLFIKDDYGSMHVH